MAITRETNFIPSWLPVMSSEKQVVTVQTAPVEKMFLCSRNIETEFLDQLELIKE